MTALNLTNVLLDALGKRIDEPEAVALGKTALSHDWE